jgi:hypothetical protein
MTSERPSSLGFFSRFAADSQGRSDVRDRVWSCRMLNGTRRAQTSLDAGAVCRIAAAVWNPVSAFLNRRGIRRSEATCGLFGKARLSAEAASNST